MPKRRVSLNYLRHFERQCREFAASFEPPATPEDRATTGSRRGGSISARSDHIRTQTRDLRASSYQQKFQTILLSFPRTRTTLTVSERQVLQSLYALGWRVTGTS